MPLAHSGLGVLAAILWLGLQPLGAAEADSSDGPVRVEKGTFTKHLMLTGELKAKRSIIVSVPRIPRHWEFAIGYMAPEGSRVGPGDLLLQFDTSSVDSSRLDLEQEREQSRIKIAQKEAEIESQRQDQLLERATKEKALKVAEVDAEIDPTLIPREEAEEHQYTYSKALIDLEKAEDRLLIQKQTAKADLEVLRLEYERQDLDLKRLMTALKRLTVRAPTSGLVIHAFHPRENRKLQVGDTVWAGYPVLKLPNMEELLVETDVHDVDFSLLKMGMTAEVTLDAYPNRTFPGRLLELPEAAKAKNPESRRKSFAIDVELIETDLNIMRPEMTARVHVSIETENALTVPRRALHLGAGGEIYALKEDSERVPIQLLDLNGSRAVIRGQLEPGQRLVLGSAGSEQRQTEPNWIRLKNEDLVFSVSGNGVLKAEKAVYITPPSLKNHYRFKIVHMIPEGSDVSKGEVLVRFDPTEIQKKLREEVANLLKSQEEYAKTKSSLELKTKDLNLQLEEAQANKEKAVNKLRQAREFQSILEVRKAEHEAVLSRKRVELIEQRRIAEAEATRLQLQVLKDAQRLYQRRIADNKKAIEATTVKAPMAGTVLFEVNRQGQKKRVGDDVYRRHTIMTLPDLKSLKVAGRVAEIDAGRIRLGQEAIVNFDGIPDQTFRGEISKMANLFQKASFDRPVKVLEVTVELDQVDLERMRPGMATRLQVVIDRFEGALAVPLSAIKNEGGKSYVWVKGKEGPIRREVELGQNNGVVALVKRGLVEGDQVSGVSGT